MPDDAAQTVLAPLQIDNSVKAGAWDAFNSSKNETELQVKLQTMKDLPDEAKASLWDAKKAAGTQQGPSQPGQQAAGLIPQGATVSAAPKQGLDFSTPQALGKTMAQPVRDYLQQAQNLTPEGAAQQPVKNIIGKAAGFLVGGNQGIGTEKGGMLTNPVLGTILGTGPGGSAVAAAASKLPNADRAGVAINAIVQGSKDLKVPVFDATAEAARGKEMFQAGSKNFPAPMRKFLMRVMNPDNPPVTLEEARDFYKNATSLTAKEWSEFDKPMQRQLIQFTQALGKNIEDALNVAKPGEGGVLRAAMDEYHSAMQLKNMGVKALKAGGAAIGASALGAAGYAGWKAVKNILP
jgi:hypothetical protein